MKRRRCGTDSYPTSCPKAGAANDGPALDAVAFAALPVGVFGIDGQAAFDHEVQRSVVLKVDVDGVMVAGEVDLDEVEGLAFRLIETVETAFFMVAGDDLVAFGYGGGLGFSFGGFAGLKAGLGVGLGAGWCGGLGGGLSARAGALRPGRGVFTLMVSHVRLCKQVDLVRARSVLITPGAARRV